MGEPLSGGGSEAECQFYYVSDDPNIINDVKRQTFYPLPSRGNLVY